MNPMKNREKMIEVSKPNLVLSIDSLIYWPLQCLISWIINCFEGYSMAYGQLFQLFCQKDFKNNNKV